MRDSAREGSVRRYVEELARRHGVVYVRTGTDALAELITNLSDDDVRANDETENLILALRRADVIDGPTMISLLGQYLDECRAI